MMTIILIIITFIIFVFLILKRRDDEVKAGLLGYSDKGHLEVDTEIGFALKTANESNQTMANLFL